MGKTGKWFKSIWAGGKKDHSKNKPTTNSVPLIKTSDNQNQNPNPTTPVGVIPRPPTPTKDKKRWSFRRPSATSAASTPVPVEVVAAAAAPPSATPLVQDVEEKTALVVAPAPLVSVADDCGEDIAAAEEAAALKIQSVFRSYLARKALKALRGLVKLQALVRGHLVRKQATATLRCMQALVTAQARARAQRIRSVEDGKVMMVNNHRHSTTHRRRSHDEKFKNPNYHDMDENIKIVEMDHAEYKSNVKSRSSYSNSMLSQQQPMNDDRTDDKISTYYSSTQHPHTKQENYGQQISPAPSAMTDLSPRTCSGYFEDYAFATAQSSPQCYSSTSRLDPSSQAHHFAFPRPDYNYAETMSYEYPLCPSYMANTKSSQAKVRSQSAPKQRPEYDRQPSRGRRPSVEGRGIPKGARMQRSSSQVGSTTSQSVQYPWSIKLDKSTVSLVDSECGSNYSMLTTNANNYCKSVVSYDPRY